MPVSSEALGARIIAVTSRFIGLTEIRPNAAWDDPSTPGPDQRARDLVDLLTLGGWESGAPYCASFYRGCLLAAAKELGAPDAVLADIRRRYSPSVMETFEHNRGIVSRVPTPGAMMLLQYKLTGRGHAGVVVKADAERYWTIEANTSGHVGSDEADREGEGIFRKPPRALDFSRKPGLWLRGFLPCPSW